MEGIEGRLERRGWCLIGLAAVFTGIVAAGAICAAGAEARELDPAHESRVVFVLEAFGPESDKIGPAVAADFPDVLKALASHAECGACRVTG